MKKYLSFVLALVLVLTLVVPASATKPEKPYSPDYRVIIYYGTAVLATKIVVDRLIAFVTANDAATVVTPTVKAEEMPVVKLGDSGDAVKTLQTKLNALGYNCGEADGVFGQNTLNAVIAFQTAKGLVADGVVGKLTWAALLG